MSEEVLTTQELALRWKMEREAISRQMAAGKIPQAFRIGKQWRIRLADVIAFEDSRKVSKPTPKTKS